jgi:monoamine oxidase
MFGLDLLARDRGGFKLEGRAPSGKGRRVIVLGGAAAGLATAFELRKLGYECSVLEARMRPGGRAWTVRRGTEETELKNSLQRCAFDEGLFFNAGAMRLSHHHQTTLDYCRAFGLTLVPFPHFNEAAFVHVDGHPRMRIREFSADLRGHTAELLAKVIRKGQLDAPLTTEDREKLIEYLRSEGRLNAALVYPRSGDTSVDPTYFDHPRGYAVSAGNDGGPGAPTTPQELEALIQAGYASLHPYDHEANEQGTMLTPVGGMDRIAYAFAERLGESLHYGAEAREIRRTSEGGVRVVYADLPHGGELREATGDFCVCTLPPHLLARLTTDFSPETIIALQKGRGEFAGKVALQFKRRFWEEDDDIYGGRSITNQAISQIYYPFDGFGSSGKGVIIGAYHMADPKHIFTDLTPAERERLTLEQGAKIHPQYPAEFDNSFSVEWGRIRYTEGSWITWDDPVDYDYMQRVLTEADGPFYFAGDWLSAITGWQAGAFVSAHRACRQLHARAAAA